MSNTYISVRASQETTTAIYPPRRTSASGNPHHACILATLLSDYRNPSEEPRCWNHFFSQMESDAQLPQNNWDQEACPKQRDVPSFHASLSHSQNPFLDTTRKTFHGTMKKMHKESHIYKTIPRTLKTTRLVYWCQFTFNSSAKDYVLHYYDMIQRCKG